MSNNIQSMVQQEKEVQKCRQEFQNKHSKIQMLLNDKIGQLQAHLKSKEDRNDI